MSSAEDSPAAEPEKSAEKAPPIQYVIVPGPSDYIIDPSQLNFATTPFAIQNSPMQMAVQIAPQQMKPEPKSSLKQIQAALGSLQTPSKTETASPGDISTMLQSIQSTLDKILTSQNEAQATPKLNNLNVKSEYSGNLLPQNYVMVPQPLPPMPNIVLLPQHLKSSPKSPKVSKPTPVKTYRTRQAVKNMATPKLSDTPIQSTPKRIPKMLKKFAVIPKKSASEETPKSSEEKTPKSLEAMLGLPELPSPEEKDTSTAEEDSITEHIIIVEAPKTPVKGTKRNVRSKSKTSLLKPIKSQGKRSKQDDSPKSPQEIPIETVELEVETHDSDSEHIEYEILEEIPVMTQPTELATSTIPAPELERMLQKFLTTQQMEPELLRYLSVPQPPPIKKSPKVAISNFGKVQPKQTPRKLPLPTKRKVIISRSCDDDHQYETAAAIKLQKENIENQLAQEKEIDVVFQKQIEEEAAYMEVELIKTKMRKEQEILKKNMKEQEVVQQRMQQEHELFKKKLTFEQELLRKQFQKEQELQTLEINRLNAIKLETDKQKQTISKFQENLTIVEPPHFPNSFKYVQVADGVFRSDMKDLGDIELWWIEFREKVKFLWMKDYIKKADPEKKIQNRSVASGKFYCSYKTRVKRQKPNEPFIPKHDRAFKCKGQINIIVKNPSWKAKKPDLYALSGYPCIIYFNNEHTHPVDTKEVLFSLKPFPKTKRRIEQYFDDGLDYDEAYAKYQKEAVPDFVKDPSKLGDPRVNPSLQRFKVMYKVWRHRNGIKLNSRYTKTQYSQIRGQFEGYFASGLATKEAYEYHKSLVATGQFEGGRLPERGTIKGWFTKWKRSNNLLPPKGGTVGKRKYNGLPAGETAKYSSGAEEIKKSNKKKKTSPPSDVEESYTTTLEDCVIEFDINEEVYQDPKHDEHLFLMFINLLNTKYNTVGCSSSLLKLLMERINDCNSTEDLEALISGMCSATNKRRSK